VFLSSLCIKKVHYLQHLITSLSSKIQDSYQYRVFHFIFLPTVCVNLSYLPAPEFGVSIKLIIDDKTVLDNIVSGKELHFTSSFEHLARKSLALLIK